MKVWGGGGRRRGRQRPPRPAAPPAPSSSSLAHCQPPEPCAPRPALCTAISWVWAAEALGERWTPATDRSGVVGAGRRPGQPGPAPTASGSCSPWRTALILWGQGELAQVGSGGPPGTVCPGACGKGLRRSPPRPPVSRRSVGGCVERSSFHVSLTCKGTGHPSGPIDPELEASV